MPMEAVLSSLTLMVNPLLKSVSILSFLSMGFLCLLVDLSLTPLQIYFFLLIMTLFFLPTFSLNFLSQRVLWQNPFLTQHFSIPIYYIDVKIDFPIERLMNKMVVVFMEEIYLRVTHSMLVVTDFFVEVVIFLTHQGFICCCFQTRVDMNLMSIDFGLKVYYFVFRFYDYDWQSWFDF